MCALENLHQPKTTKLCSIVGEYYRAAKFERMINNKVEKVIPTYDPSSDVILHMWMEFPDEWKARFHMNIGIGCGKIGIIGKLSGY
jgi:hypothetical protein